MKYVDGFVIPIKKKNVKAYLKMAKIGEKAWRKAGALDYAECVGDDLATKWGTAFPKLAKLKRDETVIFSYIVFKSKAHRDRMNKKVMKEMAGMCDESNTPFDIKRISYGGFKLLVGR